MSKKQNSSGNIFKENINQVENNEFLRENIYPIFESGDLEELLFDQEYLNGICIDETQRNFYELDEIMEKKLREIDQWGNENTDDFGNFAPLLNEDEMIDRNPSDEFCSYEEEMNQILDNQIIEIDQAQDLIEQNELPMLLDEYHAEKMAEMPVFNLL